MKVVVSNTLKITVRELRDQERVARAALPDLTDFLGAMGGDFVESDKPEQKVARDTGSKLPRWEQFARSYSQTPYAAFVEWHLASIYFYGIELQNPNGARTRELLNDLIEHGPRFLADDAMVTLMKLELREGHMDVARGILDRFMSQFQDSELVPEATRIREGLAKGRRTLDEIYSH